MNKADLLLLDDHAHLSFEKLQAVQPELAKKLTPRMAERARAAVVEHLAGGSPALRAAAARIGTPDRFAHNDLLAAVALRAVRLAIAADPGSAGNAELEAELAAFDVANGPTMAAAAGLDVPLRNHPGVAEELARARTVRLADAARLPAKTADALVAIGGVQKIHDASLDDAIKRGVLSEPEAKRAGRAVALYDLLDDRHELVGAVADAVDEPAKLAELDLAGWQAAITASKTAPPGGIPVADYAALLQAKSQAAFPTRAVKARLGAIDVKPVLAQAHVLDELRAANAKKPVLARDLSDLDTTGIELERLAELREIHRAARRAVNRYIGLRLDEVLDDQTREPEQRLAEVNRRIDRAHQLFADNANLLELDLRPRGSGLEAVVYPNGADNAERGRLLAMARSYQRAVAVAGGDVGTADVLVTAGFPSATSITASTEQAIVAATGLTPSVVSRIRERASDITITATANVGTLIDITRGGFNELAVYNVPGDVDDYLKEIPGYADFFGSQDYCDCKHCKSILGPAAYFVDLMRFIDQYIGPYFANRPAHSLALRTRRPDLWDKLELTCENTNTEIPYLEVINEILEDAVVRDVGLNLPNRAVIRDRVYGNDLRTRVNSFQQPFHLPFVELATYLKHFDRTLADLAEASRATGTAQTRLRLGLAPLDFQLITTPNVQLANLRVIYNNQFAGAPAIQPLDVQTLLPAMGITRDELGTLIATRYVTANGTANVRIRGERRDANSVQNDIERISGLTPAVLDRMHRFVRLWRATGWHMGELDLVRAHLEATGVGTDLDATLVAGVALVHRIGHVMRLDVEEEIALFSTIPDRAVLASVPGPASEPGATVYPRPATPEARLTVALLDRLFNQSRQVDVGGRYPQPNTRVTHPALALVPPANIDRNLHRLQAGLGADEDQLYQLIVGLARPLGIDPTSAVAANRELALSARNLALLYRHARLARLLKVTVPDLFSIIALTLVHGYVETLDDVEAVIRTQRWLATSRWTAAALVAVVRPGTPAVVASRAAVANTVAGTAVTYTVTDYGVARAPETVTFAANASLAAAIADWNAQAQATIAYRADARGLPSAIGDRIAIRTRSTGTTSTVEITADAAGLFVAALPRVEAGREYVATGPSPAVPTPLELARELVAEIAQAGSLVFADTVFTRVPGITDAQSRAVIQANLARLEAVDTEGRFRLAANYDPAVPLATGGLPAGAEPALRGVLAACHATSVLLGALPGKLGIAPATLDRFVVMLGDNLAAPATFAELRDPAVAPVRVASLIARIRRLAAVFADGAVFDPTALDTIRVERARFGIGDFDRIDLAAIRRIELFRTLSEPWLERGEARPDLPGMIGRYAQATGFATADIPGLAELLHCDVALVRSLQDELPRVASPFDALEQLVVAIVMCRHLGVGGGVLGLIRSDDFALLGNASAAIQAAFRAKYSSEAEWERNREPYRDAVLSRQRDGLVAYLTRSRLNLPFDEATDLYHYFLVDVQQEGVMRTSRVAAAIASLQLYIQRCIMNLEETRVGDPAPLRIPPNAIPAAEWEWRQNYRVWEANRKVFLYPENYLEPELRDDKTPLFRALEDELLSKPITEEAVREAYARYLRGFDELSALTIAGSYHERDDNARHDVLHLFGATSDDPPIFYYRRVEDAHYGVASVDRATRWGAWERVDLQIPTRTVSPVVHQGQLFLFWIRYVTKSVNQFVNGDSRFVGYSHRAHVEFSKRRLDGTWTSPQNVTLTEQPFSERGDGVILDPLVARTANAWNMPVVGVMRLYSNFQPLYDSVIHQQPMDDYSVRGFGWDRIYPTSGNLLSLRGINFQMWSDLDLFRSRIGPQKNYDSFDPPGSALKNRGVPWIALDTIDAQLCLILIAIFFARLAGGSKHPMEDAVGWIVDILGNRDKNMLWSERDGDVRTIHAITLGSDQYITFDGYTFISLLLERERIAHYKQPLSVQGYGDPAWVYPQWHPDVTSYLESLLVKNAILSVPPSAALEAVNGTRTYSDAIIQNGRDVFHIGFRTVDDKPFVLRRLGTSVAEPLARTLFNHGLDALLATSNQLATNEPGHGFSVSNTKVADRTFTGSLDFNGPMGTYLRELFFHIPFLLADHLNSLGEYSAAQRWYHVIFDPTSSEVIDVPNGLSETERRRRELDRVWRYREHRGLSFETLRAQLQNQQAIDAYKRDPFNPHAIARLRITAYQKAVVMKYIDNLIDWGDDLFARAFSELNPEYLREATLKYVLAQELLGRRPAKVGDCGESPSRRYIDIVSELVPGGSELLLELEHITTLGVPIGTAVTNTLVPRWSANEMTASAATYRGMGSAYAMAERELGRPLQRADLEKPPVALRNAVAKMTAADFAAISAKDPPVSAPMSSLTKAPLLDVQVLPSFTLMFVSHIGPAFCVPDNPTLRSYWDRVEDRLYKLRNSLDPEGVFRRLPLFAPPIDPAMLVRARAAGLGLEDVLGPTAGGLPAYRFTYLIEKAKAYASSVQAFGSALLAALEKRDGEELTMLRNKHERELLQQNRDIRRAELTAADIRVETVTRQQAAAQYRHDYFSGLIASGLSTGERVQVGFRVASTVLRGADAILKLAAGIGYLIPEVGSPFAMKYGGKQLGDSFDAFAQAISSAATLSELVSDMAGLIAGFERREEGWKHDQKSATHELKVLDRERAAAELQRDIARRSLDLHLTTMDQHDEVMELYRDKFSGLGLYTFMARRLQSLHRTAFGNALAIAQLAERAYHYELPGDASAYVAGEWEGARSGLLAGDRMLLDLGRMERRYIERNDRRLEITQSFSLEQISPAQLIALRETGSAELRIPEFYFDLFYPGHYRRQIRGVRLSIPCVTGPYTNVSARLTLLGSKIRSQPNAGAIELIDVPLGRTNTVATSSAQNDGGVFELNFRDERYNPFEGAGAVSDWRIELPSVLSPFDYRTITDVVLSISYSAEDSSSLRQTIETPAAPDGLIAGLAATPQTRAFSLRREYGSAFHRLLTSPVNTPIAFDIGRNHLPLFLRSRQLVVAGADVVLVLDGAPGAFAVSVNNTPAAGFARVPLPAPYGGLPAVAINGAFGNGIVGAQTITVTNFGGLAAAAAAGAPPRLDADRLHDIVLVVRYTA